jgi:ABC transporter transmembrane region 2
MEYNQTDKIPLATEDCDDARKGNIALLSLPTKEIDTSSMGAALHSSKFNREAIFPKIFKNSKKYEYNQVAASNQTIKGNDGGDYSSKPSLDGKIIDSASLPTSSTKQPSIRWSHVKEQFQIIFLMGLPYFQESPQARWLVVSLLFFLLLNNCLYIFYSFVTRDFWSALANQNAPEFYSIMVLYFATLLLLMAPINAWYTYQREQLVLHWRSWLTRRTLQLYTNHHVYYRMEMERHQMVDSNDAEGWNRMWIDNPDQRITEDVKAFTDLSIQLCFELCDNIIQVGSFSAILWTIDSKLLGIAMIYAMGGTIVATVLGHPLIQLNVEHLRREADLRYSLVRFREHAEGIAFYLTAAILERDGIAKRLEQVVTNQYSINLMNRTLNLFTYAYGLSLDIMPVIIVVRLHIAYIEETTHLISLFNLFGGSTGSSVLRREDRAGSHQSIHGFLCYSRHQLISRCILFRLSFCVCSKCRTIESILSGHGTCRYHQANILVALRT